MAARTNVKRQLNTSNKARWAVWIDERQPLVVSSRLKAKKLCAQAQETAYFCRCQARANSTQEFKHARITDFLVWQLMSNGHFSRYMYLLPTDTLIGKTVQPFGFTIGQADQARYKRALENENIWKLGPKELLDSTGEYPDCLDEVTADSDQGMICAGYSCICEVSTPSELRTALAERVRCCGTVDGNTLKIWVEAND